MFGGVKKLNKPKIEKQSEVNIIKYKKSFCTKKKENKEIKDRIIRDISRPFLNKKMIIINQKVIFGIIIILNMKVMVVEIKTYC